MGFLINPFWYSDGFVNGYSYIFDGVDERCDFTNISTLQNAQNFSISIWVKFNASALSRLCGRYASSTDAIFLRADPSTNDITVRVANGIASENKYSPTLTTGVWYNIIAVYDGTLGTATDRVKVYVDGSSETRTGGTAGLPSTTKNTTDTFHLSDFTASTSSALTIDEFSIFNYSLTSGQVTSIYNSGTPTDLDDTSGVTAPVHWWRMGDDAGDTSSNITDVGTTGGNNGTPINMESGDIVTDTP